MHSYSHQDLVFKETTTVLGSLSSKKKYIPMKEVYIHNNNVYKGSQFILQLHGSE